MAHVRAEEGGCRLRGLTGAPCSARHRRRHGLVQIRPDIGSPALEARLLLPLSTGYGALPRRGGPGCRMDAPALRRARLTVLGDTSNSAASRAIDRRRARQGAELVSGVELRRSGRGVACPPDESVRVPVARAAQQVGFFRGLDLTIRIETNENGLVLRPVANDLEAVAGFRLHVDGCVEVIRTTTRARDRHRHGAHRRWLP